MTTFSFIIPVKPATTPQAIQALQPLSEHNNKYEILVAEGTRPSRQRNFAAKQAQGEIIFFLDDDSIVKPECLSQCAEVFRDLRIAVVGGPSVTPATDTPLQKIFGYALSSFFGAGGVRNRYRATGASRSTTEKELILCNMAIRKDVFLAANGFDERLYPNEENELLDRIQSQGYKLVHNPAMAVERSQRKSLSAFLKQMFSYGKGRAQQTLIAKGSSSLTSFVPLVFLIYLMILPVLPKSLLFLLPILTYAALDTIFTAVAVFENKDPSATILLLILPIMHIANGCGLFIGFLTGPRKSEPDGEITVKVVKEME